MRFLASLRNDSGGGSMVFALPGNNGISRFALFTVIATYPRCHLDLPPPSSRPQGRDLMQPSSAPRKASSASRDFSLRFEMTAGVASWPSPYREHRALSARPTPDFALSCTVVATCPLAYARSCSVIVAIHHCHRDQPPLSSRPSPAVISTAGRDLMQPSSAPTKASLETRDFSLRFEMTAGGGIMAFALSGTSSTFSATNP